MTAEHITERPANCHELAPQTYNVLVALIAVWERDRRATVRDVASEACCSTHTAWRHLRKLRNLGLAQWWPGTAGTLRPVVRIVAVFS